MRAVLVAGLLAASVIAGCSVATPSTAAPSLAAAATSSAPVTAAPTARSTPAPTPTPTEAPTAAPTPTPSPPPTLTSIVKRLLADKHPSVAAKTVVAAIKAAYAAGPAPFDARGNNLDALLRGFTSCRKGEPGDAAAGGDLRGTLAGYCASVVAEQLLAFRATGIKAQYDAALAAYNYAYHTLPRVYVKGDIDDFLLQVAAQG